MSTTISETKDTGFYITLGETVAGVNMIPVAPHHVFFFLFTLKPEVEANAQGLGRAHTVLMDGASIVSVH